MRNLPRYIEFEIGSYCNRLCSWCPNSVSDRGRLKNHVSENLWKKVMKELGELDYSGWIALHNYNEPLLDPYLYDRIADIQCYSPKSQVAIYTNGDYLDKSELDKLCQVEVNEIRVTLYPSKKMVSDSSEYRLNKFIAKLQIEREFSKKKQTHRGIEVETTIFNTCLKIISPKIANYNNRAGSVLDTNFFRHSPCYLPNISAAIDWMGNVKLCCQVYSTSNNQNNILGNLNTSSFVDIWLSEKFARIRAKINRGDFSDTPICRKCDHKLNSEQGKIVVHKA